MGSPNVWIGVLKYFEIFSKFSLKGQTIRSKREALYCYFVLVMPRKKPFLALLNADIH